jgi:hypothetical protein
MVRLIKRRVRVSMRGIHPAIVKEPVSASAADTSSHTKDSARCISLSNVFIRNLKQ